MTDPTASAPTEPEKASVAEDFIDILASPAKVFARRATASPLIPYVIVCVLIVGLFFANRNVMASIMDAEVQRGMDAALKANPNLTADQLNAARAIAQKSTQFAPVVVVPLFLLVLGLATFAIGRALGGTLTYGTALLIASFAWVPRVIESVLTSVQGLVMDTAQLTSRTQLQIGPGRFLDPASMSAGNLGLVARADLITLWVTVLLAIGLVHAGKVPKNRIWLAGVLMFLVGSLPAIWAVLRA